MSFQGSNGEDCCSIGWQNYFKANDDGIPADGRRLRRTEGVLATVAISGAL